MQAAFGCCILLLYLCPRLHCVVVVVVVVVFLCGGCDCMWWWLYVVVKAVHGGDGHLCGGITV